MNDVYQIHNGCFGKLEWRSNAEVKGLNVWNGVLLCVVSNFHPKNADRMNEMSRNEFIHISALYSGSYFKFCKRRH